MSRSNEPREMVMTIRVSMEEKARIKEYAASAGLSITEYARRCMLRGNKGSPLAMLEKILLQGIRDKDLNTVKSTLSDILVFLNDLRRHDQSDSNN